MVVPGASGPVGRQVVAQLSAGGAPGRGFARDPASAGLPAGVEVVRGDLADPGSLKPHLQAVESVFLVWPFTPADVARGVAEVLARHVPRIAYRCPQAAVGRPDSFSSTVVRLIEGS